MGLQAALRWYFEEFKTRPRVWYVVPRPETAQVCYTAFWHARLDPKPPELGSVVGVSARPRCASVQCGFLRQPSRTAGHTLAERAAGRSFADFPGQGTTARFRATASPSWQNPKLDARSHFAAAGGRGDLFVLPSPGNPSLRWGAEGRANGT